MASIRRRIGIAPTAVALVAGVLLVGTTSGGGVVGPNQGDITASSPAFPGGSVTFTVTTGSSCDPTSTFSPPNSTITVLDQAGTTTVVAATNMTATATGGTVTLTLPSNLALGTYMMQFLCNHDGTSSIFGNNEFSVTAAPPTIPLLTAVQAQDMGSFDRVTFVFSGATAPDILGANYISGPAILNPKGEPVDPPIAGAARFLITLFPASSFDFSVPAVPSYTGPTRFAPDLPSVVELMQVQDFEATLQWVIGVRNLGLTATAKAFTGPSRIEVDVQHGGTASVTLSPSFTG